MSEWPSGYGAFTDPDPHAGWESHVYIRAQIPGGWDINNPARPLLADEIEVMLPGKRFCLLASGTECKILFENPLSTQEKTDLDALVADHRAAPPNPTPPPLPVFRASSTISPKTVVVTGDATWDEIGGVETTPQFFVPNLAAAVGRVVGSVEVAGTGAEIRVVETVAGVDKIITVPAAQIADTAGAWVSVGFSTTVPPSAGQNSYRIEARRNGATSFKCRYFSMSLLEMVPQ